MINYFNCKSRMSDFINGLIKLDSRLIKVKVNICIDYNTTFAS